jgi:tight adherence protein B
MLIPPLGIEDLAIFVLVAASVGCMLLMALHPRLASSATLDRRIAQIAATRRQETENAKENRGGARRRSVEDTLREVEEKHKALIRQSAKPSLAARLRQARLSWSVRTYYLVCLATGLAFGLLAWACAAGLPLAIGAGMVGGLFGTPWYVGHRRAGRFRRFTADFPNAVDVIVRGVKSGLPLVDCLKIIAAEAQAPVKEEFRTLVEDQTLGVPLEDAVQRLPERIPLPEASFFAIVIAIQSRTGGGLSEALGNLSAVLRERQKMRAKIRAVSSEAKASAGIIGSLPVIVGGLVYLTSPKYISLLFTTTVGNLVLAGSVLWMLIGILVMRKMINFDI